MNQALTANPPVYITHALGMHTKATIEAIQKNRYLNDTFVDVELRTTTRPDTTYTGTYLDGRLTYLELFVEGTVGIPRNAFELAVGTEAPGGADAVQATWNAEFDEHESPFLISRFVDGVAVPWFRAVVPAWSEDVTLGSVFSQEYVPNPGSTVPRTRLEERAARYNPDKLVKDVQAFVFAGPKEKMDLLRRALASVGWTVAARDEGFLALSPLDDGTRRAVVVENSAPEAAGLLGVVFSLNRRAPEHTERMGEAVLKVGLLGQPAAVLWLVPPTAKLEGDAAAAVTR